MAEQALGVGLHILYGLMGAGKTNYAVSVILRNSTYKKWVLNVPLVPEFKDTLSGIEITEFKKLEPEKVIRMIDENHQDTLFIVDEAQMCLMSANKLLVDSFCKKMSQIRQNNQCCVVIAQISKMLPKEIKDLAASCYYFENNNVRGIQKSSKVKHYRTGYDYSTRLIEEFVYSHVYGLYESTNTPTTEKPKNLYRRTYIKMACIFGFALLLFVFVGYKFYQFFSSFSGGSDEQENSITEEKSIVSNFVPSVLGGGSGVLCVRSWQHEKNAVVRVIMNDGSISVFPVVRFSELSKCPLFNQLEKKSN